MPSKYDATSRIKQLLESREELEKLTVQQMRIIIETVSDVLTAVYGPEPTVTIHPKRDE